MVNCQHHWYLARRAFLQILKFRNWKYVKSISICSRSLGCFCHSVWLSHSPSTDAGWQLLCQVEWAAPRRITWSAQFAILASVIEVKLLVSSALISFGSHVHPHTKSSVARNCIFRRLVSGQKRQQICIASVPANPNTRTNGQLECSIYEVHRCQICGLGLKFRVL